MNLTLHELVGEYRHLALQLQSFDDDLTDDKISALLLSEQSADNVKVKAAAVATVVLNLEALAENIRLHEMLQSQRRSSLNKRAMFLREYLTQQLLGAGITKVDSAALTISFRKSTAVVVPDPSAIPEAYMSPAKIIAGTPNKSLIGEDLKLGVIIPGAHLENRNNVVIK